MPLHHTATGIAAIVLMLASWGLAADPPRDGGAVVAAEFIYDAASFPSCHASTIARGKDGLVTAWFGGTREGAKDVGVWVARHDGKKWAAPVEVATGVVDSGERHPCWNPVLFQAPEGPLMLFYKVGPSPKTWWGMLTTSDDGGKTWSLPRRLPDGILGPIKNKPVMIGGVLLCPSSTEHDGWRVHMEQTGDLGRTWTKTEPLNDGMAFGIIQPAVLVHGDRALQIVCRSRQGKVVELRSENGGKTWSDAKAIDALPNPNSGVDAVTLKDGRHLLVYNHTKSGRSPLNVAISKDGVEWRQVVVLEDERGEFSYPAVIQTDDGLVHVTYTWKRQKIRHVVIDPAKLGG